MDRELYSLTDEDRAGFRDEYAALYRRMNVDSSPPGRVFASLGLFEWMMYEGIDEKELAFPGERLDVYAKLVGWHLVEHKGFDWRSNRPRPCVLFLSHAKLTDPMPLWAIFYRPLCDDEVDVELPDPVDVAVVSARAIAGEVERADGLVNWRKVMRDVSRWA